MRCALPRLKLTRLSVRSRLGLIQLVLLLALSLISLLAWQAINGERHSGEALAALSRAQRYHQDAQALCAALRDDVSATLLVRSDDPRASAEVLASLQENARQLKADIEALRWLDLPPDLRQGFASNHPRARAYIALGSRLGALALQDRGQALALEPRFDAAFDEIRRFNERMSAFLNQRVEAQEHNVLQEAAGAKLWIAVAAIAAALFAWTVVALLAGSIRRSLRQVCDAARALAAGNLSVRSDIESRDEVGELAVSLNKMADDLQSTVDRLLAETDRDAFGGYLAQALEMAESEVDVHNVVARAMVEIAGDMPMELLLADAGSSRLARVAEHPSQGAPACSVDRVSGCAAVRHGAPTVFPDSEALNACPRLRQRPCGTLSATCVPVGFMGHSFGVLHASSAARQPPPARQVARLTVLGIQAGARIGTLRAFERTRLHAYTDGLTGLGNRRALEHAIQELTANGSPYAFALADLDHFKGLNDRHGHDAGDRALRLFAEVLMKSIRHSDQAARWGGEEFAILFPGALAEQALDVIQRFRVDLATALLTVSGVPFTASFGIADSSMAPSFEDVLRTADEALYCSKSAGRDRATVATGAPARSVVVEPSGVDPRPETRRAGGR